jgi:hypothetical protein
MKRFVLTVLLAGGLAGCAAHAGGYPGGRGYEAPPHVPQGHMPPPGECRIWYPDLPPGQQPPPGPCHTLRYHVPPGAYLIRG